MRHTNCAARVGCLPVSLKAGKATFSGLITAAIGLTALPAQAQIYNWQPRPDIGDSYISKDMPQPVCASVNGVGKILIFSNFDFYKSQNLNNMSNAVRVGEITTPADTYVLKPGSLPGKRYAFAVASHTPAGGNSVVYLFGGRNGGGDMADVYAYDPAASTFTPVTDASGGSVDLPTPRSGVTAVSSGGLIWLFGGLSGNQVLNEVLVFDPVGKTITARPPMSKGFHGARAMVKAVGTAHHVYFVGAKLVATGGPTYEIYRYRTIPTIGTLLTVLDGQAGGAPMQSAAHPASPMVTWDPSGTVRPITAGGYGANGNWTWDRFEAGRLVDSYSNGSSNPTATLSSAPYVTPPRARDMAGAVKCGSFTYLVGGNYGHGSKLQDRSRLLDRLGPPGRGDIKAEAIKANTGIKLGPVQPE